MAKMFVYDRDKREMQALVGYARETVAYQSNDRLGVREFYQSGKAQDYLKVERMLDLAILEIRENEDIEHGAACCGRSRSAPGHDDHSGQQHFSHGVYDAENPRRFPPASSLYQRTGKTGGTGIYDGILSETERN